MSATYDDLIQQYNGSRTCARKGCNESAGWMPVIEMRAPTDRPGFSVVMPMALLSFGFCGECSLEFKISDVDDGGPTGIHAHAIRILGEQGKAPPDPDRTTLAWCDVSAVAAARPE